MFHCITIQNLNVTNASLVMPPPHFHSLSCPYTPQIDCEGCEYAAMPPLFDLIASGKVSVNQVLIELHKDLNDREGRVQRLYDFFLAADHAKFRITHKEGNHWGCEGSRCVEYTFVNESFLRDANGAIVCPSIGDN